MRTRRNRGIQIEMHTESRFIIQPRTVHDVAKVLGWGLAAFAAAAASCASGSFLIVACGLFGFGFFGVASIYVAVVIYRRRAPSYVLTENGIEFVDGSKVTASVPWRDIEKIGTVQKGGGVGVRLSSYDRLIASYDPETARTSVSKTASIGRFGMSLPSSNRIASADIATFATVRSLEDIYRADRAVTGYDIMLVWSKLDRSSVDFAKLLAQWWYRYR